MIELRAESRMYRFSNDLPVIAYYQNLKSRDYNTVTPLSTIFKHYLGVIDIELMLFISLRVAECTLCYHSASL